MSLDAIIARGAAYIRDESLRIGQVAASDLAGDAVVGVAPQRRLGTTPSAPQSSGPAIGDAIDLRLLVIAADGRESSFATITAALDRLGARYDTLIALRERLTAQRLWHDAHACYQGIILATGDLGYQDPTSQHWESAFDQEQWRLLWSYEARFGIRQVTWYTVPGGYPDDYGLRLAEVISTIAAPLPVTLTDAGRRIFWYLNRSNPIDVRFAWAYLAQPIDPATTPLLVAPGGQTVAAIRRYADGRENLALTVDNSPNLLHSLLLAYGLINWVSRGIFLGERHVYLSPQIDDIFFHTILWDPATRTQNPDRLRRIDQADALALLDWLGRLHSGERNAADLAIELAFNGEGAVDPPPEDTLVPFLAESQSRFRWVNHTFRHPRMDEVDYDTSVSEIHRNHAVASRLGLERYHPDSLVTPECSGLDHPEFMRAARAAGIRYLIADTSRLNGSIPAPNTGIVSDLQPEILIVPRHPNNMFFNVSTPAEWMSEYNHIYRSFWKRDLTFEEIVDREAETLLQYLLTFDIDPIMFHQANLHAYDGARSLLSDLIDCVLAKYNSLYSDIPIRSLSLHAIGAAMAARSAYRSAALRVTLIRGKGLILTADRDVVVPITGACVEPAAELYGGQAISSIAVSPQAARWVPISALVGYEDAYAGCPGEVPAEMHE